MRPRSGLAAKHGVTVLNSPGTVDADYRGEINVLLINHGDAPFPIRRGERIAQMVIAPVVQAQLVPVASLSTTDRGSGGFGSTDATSIEYGLVTTNSLDGNPLHFSQPDLRSRSGLYPPTPDGDTLDSICARRGRRRACSRAFWGK